MVKKNTYIKFFVSIIMGLIALNGFAQKHKYSKSDFYLYRGDNVVDVAFGTAVPNGDYSDPMFEFYMHLGYKRYITPHLNINVSYNKFNLAYKDVTNDGFMSFDVNFEGLIFPHKRFSPFAYVGGGLNAANYFEQSDAKIQGGVGVEYIFTDNIGVTLFSDYNYIFSDNLDGKVFGDANDVYWRMAIGFNFYFGGSKRKVKTNENEPTIINSNPIINN